MEINKNKLIEFPTATLQSNAIKKIKSLPIERAIRFLYNLVIGDKITEDQFNNYIYELIHRIHSHPQSESISKKTLNILIKEQLYLLLEMSIRQIKDKISAILSLDITKKYQKDKLTYRNIPIEIFKNNGINLFYLQQYKNSSDIITYDLGINISSDGKTVDAFILKGNIIEY